jgi:hypothetical protein
MKSLVLASLAFISGLAFSEIGSAQAPFAEESAASLSAREAGFRYYLDHYVEHTRHFTVFCISTEKPLPDNFLRRFSNSKLPVVWASSCDYPDSGNHVRKKNSGREEYYLAMVSFRWLSGEEAETQIVELTDGISWSERTLRISFQEAKWKATYYRTDWEF